MRKVTLQVRGKANGIGPRGEKAEYRVKDSLGWRWGPVHGRQALKETRWDVHGVRHWPSVKKRESVATGGAPEGVAVRDKRIAPNCWAIASTGRQCE